MKAIGITMSSHYDSIRHERFDKYDISWINLLKKLKLQPYPIPNNLIDLDEWLHNANIEGIILTGGNDLNRLSDAINPSLTRDNLEKMLIKYAISKKIPLIGYCRGMQLINDYFNGSLIKIENHVAKKHDVIINIFGDKKKIKVNSFHNWGLFPNNIGKELKIFATADDGSVEGFYHKNFQIKGIMWHPERIDNNYNLIDLDILNQFFFEKLI